jgi:N-acetyl-alpha-D-glucosaminyl L-malate synthase BshA
MNLRIGIVCYPTVGGSGVVATELGHALAERGHQVHFISYELPFRLQSGAANITFHQVEINRYDLFQYPDYALPLAVKMAQVAKEQKLDVFHVHYAIPHATSAYLAGELLGKGRPKVVTTLHGTDITIVGADPAYFDIVKFSIEKSDVVTCVSQDLKEKTLASFHIQKELLVIPNFFVPNKELIGKEPMRLGFVQEGEKLILHASNFRPVKRISDVIEIFARIQKKIPSKLLLVGAGPELEIAWDKVNQLNLQNKVYFIGPTQEVDCYVASSDLFLLPSKEESFGLAALEAMAYGVPVIAANVAGIPEVVVDGQTGFLSEVGDVEKMARDAIKLLSDEALYLQMSQNCMRRSRENFTVSKVLPMYLKAYQTLM